MIHACLVHRLPIPPSLGAELSEAVVVQDLVHERAWGRYELLRDLVPVVEEVRVLHHATPYVQLVRGVLVGEVLGHAGPVDGIESGLRKNVQVRPLRESACDAGDQLWTIPSP
eukprot:scaffold84_cov388-Prasinococcus_capsulatus_cf.AAC.4